MTTINPPATFAQEGTAGLDYDYVLAKEQLLLAMQDALDPLSTMMVSLKGDVAGTGSDTIRIAEVDGIGWARRFTDLSAENDSIAASAFTLGYTDLTVALAGLAHEETFQRQILSQLPGLDLDRLIAEVPSSWLATLRYKACVTATSIVTAVGSAAADLTADDYIDLVTAHLETTGVMGVPSNFLEGHQVSQLIRSFRAEPAFQASLAGTQDLLSVKPNAVIKNFAGLGMDLSRTDDVQQSGGGYVGFSVSPGGIGWGRASTDRIKPSGAGQAMYMPEYGLFLQKLDRGESGSARYEARSWLGTALGSTNVFFQRRVVSKV